MMKTQNYLAAGLAAQSIPGKRNMGPQRNDFTEPTVHVRDLLFQPRIHLQERR
jgi:hypothetical protein